MWCLQQPNIVLCIIHFISLSFTCSVANHMGNQRYGDWNNFTFFKPFNQAAHYHPYCLIKNFNNQTEVRRNALLTVPAKVSGEFLETPPESDSQF